MTCEIGCLPNSTSRARETIHSIRYGLQCLSSRCQKRRVLSLAHLPEQQQLSTARPTKSFPVTIPHIQDGPHQGNWLRGVWRRVGFASPMRVQPKHLLAERAARDSRTKTAQIRVMQLLMLPELRHTWVWQISHASNGASESLPRHSDGLSPTFAAIWLQRGSCRTSPC